jgi:hypothetical protein
VRLWPCHCRRLYRRANDHHGPRRRQWNVAVTGEVHDRALSTLYGGRRVCLRMYWLLREFRHHSFYSLMCRLIMYQLVTRYPPFHELNELGAAMKIISGQRPARPATALCSDALWTLITDCWNHDPRSRPTMVSVLSYSLAGTLSEKGGATRNCGQPHSTASNDAWYSQSTGAGRQTTSQISYLAE